MIQVRDLVVRFGDRTVLGGLTFTVEPGELLCVLGASGSGKTTLLRAIGGLIRPTSGEVRLAGEPADRAWQRCAYVFQAPRLVPWRTALGNVRLAQELRGGRANGEAARYIEMVGLAALADSYPATLSGGERQRVALARALVVDPDVLLMDEPFSALDATTRTRLRDELLRIWRERKRTIVFVTHDKAEADALSTRQLVLGSA